MDSWKGSLEAGQACEAVRDGIMDVMPGARVSLCPLADGGEGTLDIVASQRKGERIACEATGPLPDRTLQAEYLWWSDDQGALVEMACCAGLTLLSAEERDPLQTTTRGVGELIGDALARGAKKISLAVGGSATVDGGVGMASALGWRFLDAAGEELPPGGVALERLETIVPPKSTPWKRAEVEVWCDVTNPLAGPKGAAPVFGPQKGADEAKVNTLASGLERLAQVAARDLGVDVANLPGAGAAGGLAAGAVLFLGAKLVPGIDALIRLTGLADRVAGADWVVTGEGRVDAQSLDGKVISGVKRLADGAGARVALVAGSVDLSAESLRNQGFAASVSANEEGLPLQEAMARAPELARAAGARLAAHARKKPATEPSPLIPFHIERQPDQVSCGATCLHALYRYYGLDLPLARLVREVPQLKTGGTHGVLLGQHALRHGFEVDLITYNLHMFDPTWFQKPGVDLQERLIRQMEVKTRQGFQRASRHYLEFLKLGGRVQMRDLSPELLLGFLRRRMPILTGLNSTFLYREARVVAETNVSDELRGTPEGHFVVICGNNPENNTVRVADPYHPNALGQNPLYDVPLNRLLNAILLAIVTYDANLVVLRRAEG